MTLVLRDSIDAPLIPPDTPVVAGYGDGKYIWSPSWKDGSNWFDLFPNSVKLVIVVFAGDAGDILDIETGDATPADAPGWCQRFSRPGRRAPTLYCNRGTWPAVIAALQQAGIDPAGPGVDWWISTLDGTTDVAVPPGGKTPTLVQVTDTGAYDESVILDPSWAGLEDNMTPEEHGWLQDLYNGWFTQQTELLALQAGQAAAKTELDSLTASVAALQAAGVPPATLQPVLDSIAKLGAHLGVGTA